MSRHFGTDIVRHAVRGLNVEQVKRVETALEATLLYGILERLSGNSKFTGPAAKIEPFYADKVRQLAELP